MELSSFLGRANVFDVKSHFEILKTSMAQLEPILETPEDRSFHYGGNIPRPARFELRWTILRRLQRSFGNG